ncbi:putative glucose-6-phosphate 1-epimerase [Gossypium arboreum]|uniref:putative glucose-6-phosphate 1-epimerase n=1 Tax=Gossypium arboreum TaxID=29729 RepID=UPI0022F1C847|nr:putative glucose-6-phosphate 1-epimerase [Gossypium arboreum]
MSTEAANRSTTGALTEKQQKTDELKPFSALTAEPKKVIIKSTDMKDDMQKEAVNIAIFVDKIYLSAPTKIAILDHERKRTFEFLSCERMDFPMLGNRHFKKGKFELAKAKYEKVLREFNHALLGRHTTGRT